VSKFALSPSLNVAQDLWGCLWLRPASRRLLRRCAVVTCVGLLAGSIACSEQPHSTSSSPTAASITLQSDVAPVTQVDAAQPRVFIPPYLNCRAPTAADAESGTDSAQVCTHVAISGCTEAGKYFPDYASCDVVRTQRPFWVEAPAKEPSATDPRLADTHFMSELSWVTKQVEACGCTCCHDSRQNDGKTGQWDITRGPIWLDTLSDSGLALFVGDADSSALGAYPAQDNHGFDRSLTGLPTDDTARMQAFLRAELARRGISAEQSQAVPPFGGPIYTNRFMQPIACTAQGVDPSGQMQLGAASVRYLYVMSDGSENPGVPPNMDTPEGTLWRLDVLPSADALTGSFPYASTPTGSFQVVPERERAPALKKGGRYHFVALRDVGLPVINCTFTFGEDLTGAGAADGGSGKAGPVSGAGGQAVSMGAAGAAGNRGQASAPAAAGSGGSPDSSMVAAGGSASDGSASVAGHSGSAADSAGHSGADSTGAAGSAGSAMCALAGGDASGFGASCSDGATNGECSCAANYCALMPGQTAGYCTITGCKQNPGLCPKGWSCFDLSAFSPSLPSICTRP
jgi:hypothetical protein